MPSRVPRICRVSVVSISGNVPCHPVKVTTNRARGSTKATYATDRAQHQPTAGRQPETNMDGLEASAKFTVICAFAKSVVAASCASSPVCCILASSNEAAAASLGSGKKRAIKPSPILKIAPRVRGSMMVLQ